MFVSASTERTDFELRGGWRFRACGGCCWYDAGDAGAVVDAADLAGNLANGAAVKVRGLKLYGSAGVGSKAVIEQTIWAKGGDAASGGGVYINIGRFDGVLDVAAVEVGGASLGGVKVRDIDLSGMTQRIYGH